MVMIMDKLINIVSLALLVAILNLNNLVNIIAQAVAASINIIEKNY